MTGTNLQLASQQCRELSAEDGVLNEQKSASFLQQLSPEWQLEPKTKTISHAFTFKNYYQTMAFVNVIAQIAHQQNHHPDLLVCYNKCTVTYSTHSVGGLSINDFICAAKINAAQNL